MIDDLSHQRQLELVVIDWLAREPNDNFPEAQHQHFRVSTYRRLLVSLSDNALQQALERQISIDDFKDDFLGPISRFMESWEAALYNWDSFDARLWWHRLKPLEDAKASKGPEFNKAELEFLIGDYVKVPCRSEQVDRLLIDCLIAMEIYAFARELLDKKFVGRVSFMKGNGPLGFLGWRLASAALVAVILIPVWALQRFNVLGEITAIIYLTHQRLGATESGTGRRSGS